MTFPVPSHRENRFCKMYGYNCSVVSWYLYEVVFFLNLTPNCLLTYLLTYLLINCMEQSPSAEANRFSASQEIPRILWNPKVHYRIHKCPPSVPILSHLDPVIPLHPTTWRTVLILSSHLRLGLSSGLLPSVSPPNPCTRLSTPPYALYSPSNSFISDFITRTILG